MKATTSKALGLLLAFAWTMPASANNGVEFFSADWTAYSDLGGSCLNEVVKLEFHLDVFEQFLATPSGGVHFLSNGYATIVATGLSSGYVWLGKGRWPGVGNRNRANEWTDIQNFAFVPVGDGPRWQTQSRWRYTFDGNGVLRNEVLLYDASCTGKSPR